MAALQFKLVLLGETAVGKSSLVLRFVKQQFFEYQESTIGAAFLTRTVVIDDVTIKFENLGHGRTREIPQSSPDVLPRSGVCDRGV